MAERKHGEVAETAAAGKAPVATFPPPSPPSEVAKNETFQVAKSETFELDIDNYKVRAKVYQR